MTLAAIKQPIDLFIQFQVWSDKLKTLHSDHYFRFMAAYNVMRISRMICNDSYEKAFAEQFPSDPKLQQSMEVIAIAAAYMREHKKAIFIALAIMEHVENEPNKELKAAIKKESSSTFENDAYLRDIVTNIKAACQGSLTNFYGMRAVLRKGQRNNPLLKPLKSPA